MGLATIPSASDGVLCIILVNTAVPFILARDLIRSLLLLIGIHLSQAEPSSSDDGQDLASTSFYLEEFRTRTPTVRFEFVCKKKIKKETEEEAIEVEYEGHDDDECAVCLNGFEPDSKINNLSCGHLFHNTCLERWVDYWNFTCPLCRNPLMVFEENASYLW